MSFDQKITSKGGTVSLENPSDRSKNLMVSRSNTEPSNFVVESNAFSSTTITTSDGNYHNIKMSKQGTTLTVVFDNSITKTFTVDNSFNIERTPKFRIWASNTAYIKNLKIKEL